VHGLDHYGLSAIGNAIHAAGHMLHAVPAVGALLEWIVIAALSGVLGLVIGAVSIPLAGYVIAPAWKRVKTMLRRRERVA
jgi:predicted DNA repair protein MutK